jgi:hypothetical protein
LLIFIRVLTIDAARGVGYLSASLVSAAGTILFPERFSA